MYFSTGDIATLFISIFLLVAGLVHQMMVTERLGQENDHMKQVIQSYKNN